MDYYKRYMGDYQRDTGHLSLAAHGAFTVLLDHYYSKREPLPASLEDLHRLCRAMTKPEQSAVNAVATEFFPLGGDGLRHNDRADKEIRKWDELSAQASAAGQASAESRWGAPKAKNTRSERLSAARKRGTHTEAEWRALLVACDDRCVRCRTAAKVLEGGVLCKDHIVPVYQGGSDSIENIQPMCRNCNSRKGADTTDLRPTGWRDVFTKTLNEISNETPSERLTIGERNAKQNGNGMPALQLHSQKPSPILEPEPTSEPELETRARANPHRTKPVSAAALLEASRNGEKGAVESEAEILKRTVVAMLQSGSSPDEIVRTMPARGLTVEQVAQIAQERAP